MQSNTGSPQLDIVIPLLGVTRGGGIRVISELANGLALSGHSITIITAPVSSFPFPLAKQVKLVSRQKTIGESNFAGRIKDFFFVCRHTAETGRIVLSNYYTTFFIGLLLQVFKGKKHVYFIQGFEAEFFNRKLSFANKIKTLLAKITYSIKPDLRITISQFIKTKIGKNDVMIINDGIDPSVFKPKRDKPVGKIVICSIALTEPRKGFYDFVKAIEVLSLRRTDFEVLLFTSQANAQFNVPFSFTIKYPENDYDVVECMQNCDIFVSASHLEGFGLPGLEAMACGAALITTNSGGVTQYATDGINSLIIKVGDVEALIIAIEKLLDNPGLLKKLSDAGLATSTMFTWDIMCDNFERELTKLQ